MDPKLDEQFEAISNEQTYQLSFSSNHKQLNISIIHLETQEHFNSYYTKEDFIEINKSFNLFTSIQQIHKRLTEYVKFNLSKISLSKQNNNIILKCNDLIKGEESTFYIYSSIIDSQTISITNNHIRLLKHSNTSANDKKGDYTFDIDFLLEYYHSSTRRIFIIVLSLALLICLVFLIRFLTFSHPFTPSFIVSKADMDLISNWIEPNYLFNYTLLYRATRDGDSINTLNSICFKKGKILLLISTKDNWTFGGFTDTSSDTHPSEIGWLAQPSKDSFLFSLNKKKKYTLKKGEMGGLMYKGDMGLKFGRGDFTLSEGGLTNTSSCDFPLSFGNETNEINEFNGGKNEFVAKEIELYLINNIGVK